jgi:hypothetical protein
MVTTLNRETLIMSHSLATVIAAVVAAENAATAESVMELMVFEPVVPMVGEPCAETCAPAAA